MVGAMQTVRAGAFGEGCVSPIIVKTTELYPLNGHALYYVNHTSIKPLGKTKDRLWADTQSPLTGAKLPPRHLCGGAHMLPPVAGEPGTAAGHLPGQPRAPAFGKNHLRSPGTRGPRKAAGSAYFRNFPS